MIEKIRTVAKRCAYFFTTRTHCILGLAVLTAVLLSVLAMSVNTVNVDVDGTNIIKIKTMLSDSESILELVDVSYGKDDKIVTTNPSFKQLNISVNYAFPVYVTVGDTTSTVITTGDTVGNLLDKANVLISENDIINYDLDAFISATTYIDVIDIDYITETYIKRIYYYEKKIYSSDYPQGTRIVTGGSEGQKQITCKKTVVNGVVTNEEILDEVVLCEAVDRQVIIGTKKAAKAANVIEETPSVPASGKSAYTTSDKVSSVSTIKPVNPIELDENGNPINYSKHLTVQATAYLASGNCATGRKCTPGCIAVNPNFIPYGTRMYIKTSDGAYVYGYAIAADTGGFARKNPTKVDLAFATEALCRQFGRRNIEIYILD